MKTSVATALAFASSHLNDPKSGPSTLDSAEMWLDAALKLAPESMINFDSMGSGLRHLSFVMQDSAGNEYVMQAEPTFHQMEIKTSLGESSEVIDKLRSDLFQWLTTEIYK